MSCARAHPVRVGEAGGDHRQQARAGEPLGDVLLADPVERRVGRRLGPALERLEQLELVVDAVAERARRCGRGRRRSLCPAAPGSRRCTSANGGMTFAGSCVCRPVGVTVIRVIAGTIPASIGCWAAAQATAASGRRRGGAEAVERARDRRGQLRRRLVIEQPLAPASAARRRTLSAPRGHRRVAGAPVEAEPDRGDLLLADRDRHDAAAVGELEQRAAALVDRVVAAQVVGARGRARTSRRRRCCAPRRPRRRGRRRRAAARRSVPPPRRRPTRAASSPFMSAAPRPITRPSRSSPANGGTVQSASGAGTTSVCAISISDGPSPAPAIRATRLSRSGSGPSSSLSTPASAR